MEHYAISEDGEFSYTCKVKHTKKGNIKYKLKRAKSDSFTNSEEVIIKAKDNGGGIKIEDKFFEYHELAELHALLKLMFEHYDIAGDVRIFKEM